MKKNDIKYITRDECVHSLSLVNTDNYSDKFFKTKEEYEESKEFLSERNWVHLEWEMSDEELADLHNYFYDYEVIVVEKNNELC